MYLRKLTPIMQLKIVIYGLNREVKSKVLAIRTLLS